MEKSGIFSVSKGSEILYEILDTILYYLNVVSYKKCSKLYLQMMNSAMMRFLILILLEHLLYTEKRYAGYIDNLDKTDALVLSPPLCMKSKSRDTMYGLLLLKYCLL